MPPQRSGRSAASSPLQRLPGPAGRARIRSPAAVRHCSRVACRWVLNSIVMADEPQNVVAVMSAMIATTPGVRTAASSSPTWAALVMSISAGMRTIANSAGSSGSSTGLPFGKRANWAAVLGLSMPLRAVTSSWVAALHRNPSTGWRSWPAEGSLSPVLHGPLARQPLGTTSRRRVRCPQGRLLAAAAKPADQPRPQRWLSLNPPPDLR